MAEGRRGAHAEYKDGRVLLRWKAATDNEAIYGYAVLRAHGAGILVHYASVRGGTVRFEDARVAGGESYRYALRPYDLAGNRGPASPSVTVAVPEEHVQPDAEVAVAKDPGKLEACTSA